MKTVVDLMEIKKLREARQAAELEWMEAHLELTKAEAAVIKAKMRLSDAVPKYMEARLRELEAITGDVGDEGEI